ncbi:hypothetical protein [Spirosoma validum]|uniref:Uncharacterized protein n=1 Tax=Spirosoma validum TaxID=2771355 RepID=A0A927B3L0_9BACT|nr:hypothetical protein [Spirosoma validum]MBD2755000.1 hypothetical protein [Spirosoma validum]
MKSLSVALLLSITLVHLFAQTVDSTKTRPVSQPNLNDQRNGYEIYQSTGQIIGASPYTMINTIDNRYEGLRGSPYFLPEWNKGQIEMIAGQNYKDVPIKFDAYRQHLILLRTRVSSDSIIVNADQVKSFQFATNDGQFYVFRRYPTAKTADGSLREGYFLVLYQRKSALLKRIVKTLRKADYKNPYSSDTRYDEFRTVVSYYLLKPDQRLVKVKLSDKTLEDALGDHKDELKAFVKQENLSFKNENDAIQLVKKYDSL